MPPYTSLYLQSWLLDNTKLDVSWHMGVAEKPAMFIDIIGQSVTKCGIQERFQYSGETVSRYLHQVLNAFVKMHAHYVQLPDKNYLTNRRITEDLKYAFYFQDYLGALDGTNFNAYILFKKRILY